MISKIEIEKNVLDLSYQRNLQLLNTILLIGTGSFISYLAALIIDFSKLMQYTVLLVVIASITLIFYKRVDGKLKKISEEIRNLANRK